MDVNSRHSLDSSQTGKPRLLLLTHEYPRLTGDASFLAQEIAALAQRFQVTLVPLAQSDLPFGEVPADVRVIQGYRSPTRAQILPHYLRAYSAPEVKEELADARQNPRAAKLGRLPREARYRWAAAQYIADSLSSLLGQEEFDLLYSFWMHTETLALLKMAELQEKRTGHRPLVISRTHGYELYEERSPVGRQLFKALEARKLDGVYFACQVARDYFDSRWELKNLDTGVFYLGTESQETPVEVDENKDALTLISCSNSIPLKRIDVIIQALAQIDGLTLDWHHIGDGEIQAQLQAQAQELLDPKPNITWTFHGMVANKDLKDLYRSLDADLFLTTSSTEGGVPVSIQEAFSLGIPAIGTAVGGIPEIVREGQTGFLLDAAAAPDALAQAICRFASLPEDERSRMSQNALSLQRASFDSADNAAAFAQHLIGLVESRRG